ncbi:MAG: hypothetical protein HY856_13670 [Burkholderiales bacterium]|nr:hypothetical protein [Burkholderiales bacterium]
MEVISAIFSSASAIVAFLGGNFARMVWGELSAWWTKRQDHAQELARLEAQGRLEAQMHKQRMEMATFEAERGVQMIEVQSGADLAKIDAQAFLQAVGDVAKPTGVRWVDAWNGVIRPGLATWSVIMLTADYAGWLKVDDDGKVLIGAILGIYVASRDLFKRAK